VRRTAGLPDGFQQWRLADTLVASDERQVFRACSGADETVGWIVRIVIGKLRGQSSDFWRDRLDRDPLADSGNSR
jgi:hypothetical protein